MMVDRKRIIKTLNELMSGIDFDFGGFGDMSVLAEDEPDHYAVKVMELIHDLEQEEKNVG